MCSIVKAQINCKFQCWTASDACKGLKMRVKFWLENSSILDLGQMRIESMESQNQCRIENGYLTGESDV